MTHTCSLGSDTENHPPILTCGENMSLPNVHNVAGDRDPMQSEARSALMNTTAKDAEDNF